MISVILWYLVISLVGLLTFPLIYRLFPALPDRGYAFSRTLGWLLWGFLFWLLGSLGVLKNDLGSLLIVLATLAGLGYWALQGIDRDELKAWFRARLKMVITVELLFIIALAFMALVRSANPEATGTEKPMEMAFINAILRSPSMPPHDPWLSGYAISYYYFGYVLVSMMALATSVSGAVAFNLGISLVFALGAVGAFGMVYNLLEVWRAGRKEGEVGTEAEGYNWFLALLGPVFVLLVSNLGGLMEILQARGRMSSKFWAWLQVPRWEAPPPVEPSWIPNRYLWWWQSSRVVQDYALDGHHREIIDEFPAFSFILGDLHPHVLALPFAFLAMALALNLYLGGGKGEFRVGRLRFNLSPLAFGTAALILGGMAFLNTWDFPMYVAVFAGAYALLRAQQDGWRWARLGDFLGLSVALALGGILLYLPYYVGFSSQAGGVIPNLIYSTRGSHLWLMFATLFLPIGAYLIYLWNRTEDRSRFWRGLALAFGFILVLFLLSLAGAYIALSIPEARGPYLGVMGAGEETNVFGEGLSRRFLRAGSLITLAVLIAGVVGLFWPRSGEEIAEEQEEKPPAPAAPQLGAHGFSLLLLLIGALLVLAPEFFYLRDNFGWRINTIFKFYYQAWLMWGVVAAFGAAVLLKALRTIQSILYGSGLALLLVVGMSYTVFGINTKTNGFQREAGLTLDGTAPYLNADELAAVLWLQTAPLGPLTEAVGGSYSAYGRISVHSGQPSLLGWPGHEGQWRGGYEEVGSRQADIERLYRTSNWQEAAAILEKYGIRYIFVGSLEYSTYGVNETKFQVNLVPVFQQGQVTIYLVP